MSMIFEIRYFKQQIADEHWIHKSSGDIPAFSTLKRPARASKRYTFSGRLMILYE